MSIDPPADVGLRLRDDADFRRYWLSRLLSLTGTLVTLIALPVLVYRLSGSPLLTALVSACEAIAYLVFGLFAGALSDRWNRKRVMVWADLVNAAVMLTVPVAHLLDVLTIPHLMVVAFVSPAIATFFDGANFGALPVLVGRHRIAEANARVWGAQTVAEIVVPSAVGVGLAVLHPATMLAVDAVSYLVSAWLILRIGRVLHDAERERAPLTVRNLFADIREGLAFLVAHPGVRTMTVVGALQCVAGGGFVALMVAWCDRVLDIGTEGLRFGLVYGGWSVGALIASVSLPRLLRRTGAARICLLALPASAALGVVAASMTQWPFAVAALFAWSCAYTLVVVNSISYRQEVTPEPLMSRVNTAGRMLAWGLGWTVGAAAGGALGSIVGLRPAMITMACVSIVAAVVAWTSPLRRLVTSSDDSTAPSPVTSS